MVDENDIETIKKPLKAIKQGTDYLQKYSKASRELMEAGKEASQLQKIAGELGEIDKLSKGVAVASFGVSAVEALIGAPDKNDQILAALADLKHDLTGMWVDLSQKLDAFHAEFQTAIAELKIHPSLKHLLSLKSDLATFVQDGSSPNLTLGRNNTADIKADFLDLGKSLGETRDSNANALWNAYASNYGSFTMMRGLVSMYLDIAFMMPTAYAVVNKLSYDQKLSVALLSEDQMNEDLAVSWENIVTCCQQVLTALALEEDNNIRDMIDNLPEKVTHPQVREANGELTSKDADDSVANPGRNYFHVPAQAVLDSLEANWPDVNFWVISGKKYLNEKWCWAHPSGCFAKTHAFRLIQTTNGDDYTLTVFWTRKPANSGGKAQAQELFDTSYDDAIVGTKTVDYGNNGVRGEHAHTTFKGYVYRHGLVPTLKEWSTESANISGGTGGEKNTAWAMRSNAYDRAALWLYPTWTPLDATHNTVASDALTHVTLTGSEGVAYVLIW